MKMPPFDEIVAKTIGVILLLLIVVAFSWHIVDQLWLTCPHNLTSVELARPFSPLAGHSFASSVPQLAQDADTSDNPQRSRYLLCEGSQIIGPAHSVHDEVARLGQGRYSHWGDTIIFSASDNTDPNKNGRRYVAVQPRAR